MKKTDKRKNAPGAPDRGLGEDAQLVRGPKELIEAMRERAAKDGQTVSVAWRRAAEAYLSAAGRGVRPT